MQQRIRSRFFRRFGEQEGVGCAIAARTRDDRNAALGSLDGKSDQLNMLFIRKSCTFTSGSGNDKRIRAVAYLLLNQRAEQVKINRQIFFHGSDKSGGRAGKNRFFHRKSKLLSE